MNFFSQHQRKLISPLASSILKGTALGLSMTMLAFIPSILAQPDTGNSNNSTTPSALPGVSPSPGVNQPRPMNRNTLNPTFLPQPNPSVPTNETLPEPTNDNNGIPGAQIDQMNNQLLPSSNSTTGSTTDSTNTNHHSLNNSDDSNNGTSRSSSFGQDSNLNSPNNSIDSSGSRPSSHGQNTNLNNPSDNPATSRNNGGSRN